MTFLKPNTSGGFALRHFILASICSVFVFLGCAGVAQETSTDEANDVVQNSESSWFTDKVVEIITTEPLSALVAAIVGIFIVPVLQNIAHRSRINKIFSGVRIERGHKKNSIMMLGLGGSGKTTLSRRICGDMNKAASEETKTFKLFEGKATNGSQVYDFYISDYEGQNVGTLITGFIQQQLQERSPFRFGDVNSLILVVDVVGHKAELDDVPPSEHPSIKEIDGDRVQESVLQWNRTALDAIFGMHTVGSLRYVCLYVNKRDRLANWNNATEQKIRKSFNDLAEDLRRRCFTIDEQGIENQYAVFDFMIGSAAEQVPVELLDKLQALSVPLDENIDVVKQRLATADE